MRGQDGRSQSSGSSHACGSLVVRMKSIVVQRNSYPSLVTRSASCGVQVLHQRGYHRLRVLPGVSPSGMHWRVAITNADNLIDHMDYPHVMDLDTALWYSTGGLTEFAGGAVTVTTRPESVADLILNELPGTAPTDDDPRTFPGSPTSCVSSSSPRRHPSIRRLLRRQRGMGDRLGHRRQAPLPTQASDHYSTEIRSKGITAIDINTGRHGERPVPTRRRLCRRRRGFPREPARWQERFTHGETRCCPVSQSNSRPVMSAVPTVQLFFFEDKYVHLGGWPAELQAQYA